MKPQGVAPNRSLLCFRTWDVGTGLFSSHPNTTQSVHLNSWTHWTPIKILHKSHPSHPGCVLQPRKIGRSTCPLFTRPFSLLVRPSVGSLTLSSIDTDTGKKNNAHIVLTGKVHQIWLTNSYSFEEFVFFGWGNGKFAYLPEVLWQNHRISREWSAQESFQLGPSAKVYLLLGTSITNNITQISRVFPTSLLNTSL